MNNKQYKKIIIINLKSFEKNSKKKILKKNSVKFLNKKYFIFFKKLKTLFL